MSDIQGKTIVVTGATSGIGRATAIGLARLGARLVLLGRNPERCSETLAALETEAGRSDVDLVRCDMSTLAGIRAAADEVSALAPRIDVLVNNAGVTMTSRTETGDGFETTFAVNHLAYFAFTGHLLPNIVAAAPARIVNVASDAHRFVKGIDLDDLQSERSFSGMRVYGQSKAANIHFTRELARRLEGTGVTVNALHPGGIRSNLGRGNGALTDALHRVAQLFLKSPEQGASTSIYLATDPGVAGKTGGYYARSRPAAPARHCLDDATAENLWKISEKLTGVAYP